MHRRHVMDWRQAQHFERSQEQLDRLRAEIDTQVIWFTQAFRTEAKRVFGPDLQFEHDKSFLRRMANKIHKLIRWVDEDVPNKLRITLWPKLEKPFCWSITGSLMDLWMLPDLQLRRRKWPLALALRFMPPTVVARYRILWVGCADRANHFTGRLLHSGLPERLDSRRRYRNEVGFSGVAQLGKMVFDLLQFFVESLFDGRAFLQEFLNGRFLLRFPGALQREHFIN
jgi:hypothetical protein